MHKICAVCFYSVFQEVSFSFLVISSLLYRAVIYAVGYCPYHQAVLKGSNHSPSQHCPSYRRNRFSILQYGLSLKIASSFMFSIDFSDSFCYLVVSRS